MNEIKEVLRLWLEGQGKRWIGRRVGLDPKTVRGYIEAAEWAAVTVEQGVAGLTDERFAAVMADLQPESGRPRGDAWALCESQREKIAKHLQGKVKLTKARKLLLREGVDIPYSTLHRFAVAELGFGRTAPTIPVADGAPGDELELDTGWVLFLEPDAAGGRRRKRRAWIFTPNVSRYRFAWPIEKETTVSAIEACEAAWEFYDGIFKTLRPDNTKAIVVEADPLDPRITPAFLEYAQARGFHIDPARVRKPKDKARVERSVQVVRDDCFGGEKLRTLDEARARARVWSETEYGMKRHTRTLRLPREHFLAVEKTALLAAPTAPYDVPLWCDPKVGRDQLVQVALAFYSVPSIYVGKTLRARADRALVRIFFGPGPEPLKIHARQPPGGRSIDRNDYPKEKTAYALRDVTFLQRQASEQGEHVGRFAKLLLDGPLPWTRMRQVYALLGLCKRYGARVDEACARALAAGMTDVRRLERMLKLAGAPSKTAPPAAVVPTARYLRPPEQYALLFAPSEASEPAAGPPTDGDQ